MLTLYRWLIQLLSPLLWLYLRYRCWKGKEDPKRLRERFGFASQVRPSGELIHIHAASVGESIAVLPLIDALVQKTGYKILVTTGTVTSAQLMAKRLPTSCIHQFLPLDHPGWMARFFEHWRPTLTLLVESDLWPHLIQTCGERKIPLVLLNARFSPLSRKRWGQFKGVATALFAHFDLILSQSPDVTSFFQSLGITSIKTMGNIKFAAAPLTYSEAEFKALKKAIGQRPLWVAASTHLGEEVICTQVHKALRETHPDLLTIIVPRHPKRGPDVAAEIDVNTALRSQTQTIPKDCEIYIADTMGELGLFYALSPIAFVGGSFVPIGGHNPIEPALLDCAIIWGPQTFNFVEVSNYLRAAAWQVNSKKELMAVLDILLKDPKIAQHMALRAKLLVECQQHVLEQVMESLAPYLKGPVDEKSRLLA